MAGDVDGGELFVADFDASVVRPIVQLGVDLQPGGGLGSGDQVDHNFEALQRLAVPVEADEAEQAVPNLFHLELPGGKWQTRMASPVVPARRCSSTRHSRVRGLLAPPESAVIVSVWASG